MDLTTEHREYAEQVASEVLAKFDEIAKTAIKNLREMRKRDVDPFAIINTMTSVSPIQKLDQIIQSIRNSYEILASEPTVARVVVEDENREYRIYYICRTMPIQGIPNLASYRAPIGRLASLDIGDDFSLPNGTSVTVLERSQLRPIKLENGWDSHDTVMETEHFGPITIESLKALLTNNTGETVAEDILGQLLAEEASKVNIISGIHRSIITKMELRDQPILDKYQDEIFRLPLDTRLLILGPPGTGKTTTLIRRLGQKVDSNFLDEKEKRLVETLANSQNVMHSESWLMFTPTELLKQYLKEAFAREGVPASDLRIKTWQDYRRELARNVFGVLKTGSGEGTFILKDDLSSLKIEALEQPIQWFEDFNAWQRNAYVQELHVAANMLRESKVAEVQRLGKQLHSIMMQASEVSLESTFESLANEISDVQELVTSLKEASDRKIREALNLQLNKDPSFLDELAHFIDDLQQTPEIEADEEEKGIVTGPHTGRAAAVRACMQAMRAKARAVASNRIVSKSSRNGKIIEWLSDHGLTGKNLIEVGEKLLAQTYARRFLNPVKRYLDSIPKRYRVYRRERQKAGNWYCNEGFVSRDIHPLELDIVLLAILRAASDLMNRPNVQRNIDKPIWSALQTIQQYYRNQILVDEATDFSPVQLACMAALTHPRLRSFFACGDFNQRLTTWGTRSIDEMKWIFADFDIKEINVSYRQSKQLNDLAHALIQAVGGTTQHIGLPAHMDSEGVAPALLEHASDTKTIINWLADRIREIERFVGQLPSIAIFVNTEDDVVKMAEALNLVLSEYNIQVIACREGQTVGQETSVRVFNIEHIKGLEFEAVFFIGIDQLATIYPTLFDKYLYVGITRAATYLGITCNGTLPAKIKSLSNHFCPNWQTPG